MAERLLTVTAYLIYQFLMLILTSLSLLVSALNLWLKQMQRSLEQTSEPRQLIHYEVHQHVHLEQPTAYLQTVDNVSRHLPVPLQQVRHLPSPAQTPLPVKTVGPMM